MNTLDLLSQMTTLSEEYTLPGLTSDEVAILVGFMLFIWVISLAFTVIAYVVSSLCLMRIFAKANVQQWAAWVPFYNTWKMLEIGGQQGFWAVLGLVPVVNIVSVVFLVIAEYNIGLKLGKSGTFVLWAIFLPFVWLIWLAVDKSKWNDKAENSTPSLHKA